MVHHFIDRMADQTIEQLVWDVQSVGMKFGFMGLSKWLETLIKGQYWQASPNKNISFISLVLGTWRGLSTSLLVRPTPRPTGHPSGHLVVHMVVHPVSHSVNYRLNYRVICLVDHLVSYPINPLVIHLVNHRLGSAVRSSKWSAKCLSIWSAIQSSNLQVNHLVSIGSTKWVFVWSIIWSAIEWTILSVDWSIIWLAIGLASQPSG